MDEFLSFLYMSQNLIDLNVFEIINKVFAHVINQTLKIDHFYLNLTLQIFGYNT